MSIEDDKRAAAISRDLLARLPRSEPPAHLWPRVAATREERRQAARRRWRLVGGVIAATLLLGVGLSLRLDQPAHERFIAAAIADSRLLEARLSRFELQRPTLAPLARAQVMRDRARLRTIDAELSAAYAGAGADDRLEALWTRRVAVLGRLLASLELAAQVDAAGTGAPLT